MLFQIILQHAIIVNISKIDHLRFCTTLRIISRDFSILVIIKKILVKLHISSKMYNFNTKVVNFSLIVIFIAHMNIFSATIIQFMTFSRLRYMSVNFAVECSKIRYVK